MTEKQKEGETLTFIYSESGVSRRVDVYLATKLLDTRSQIKKLIDSGQVLINGGQVKAGYLLQPGDKILVTTPPLRDHELQPQNISLDIIYEDDDLAVINKQPGLAVHPGAGTWDQTLVNALLYYGFELSSVGGPMRPGIVHRLDKDTSGLMLIAKNDRIHRELAGQLKRHLVHRYYLALVHGGVKIDQGKINGAIGRHPKIRTRMAIVAAGRQALTYYQVKDRFGSRYTLLECQLETGRTHQIRVHLASINHPIVGDQTYGIRRNNLGSARQMLHASKLGFFHPDKGWLEFCVQPPRDFTDILAKAGKMS